MSKTSTMNVSLNEVEKLKKFVNVVSKTDLKVKAISSVDEDYVINAKSIFGLLSLNLSEPIIIQVKDVDEEVDKFFDSIAEFACN
ncbi:MAG: HPr family phosphocarrier protein [Lachnospiraceae bacterium]|nr:HPr family phosphocarrier protein [Lachnospiraceae bacterium]